MYVTPFLSDSGVRNSRVEVRAFTSYRNLPAWPCHCDLTLGSMIISSFLTTAAARTTASARTTSPTTAVGGRGTTTSSNKHCGSHSSCTSRRTALIAGALVLATCGTTSCSAFAPGPRGVTVLRPSSGSRGSPATSPVGRRSAKPGAQASLWAGGRRGGGGLAGSVRPELHSPRRWVGLTALLQYCKSGAILLTNQARGDRYPERRSRRRWW